MAVVVEINELGIGGWLEDPNQGNTFEEFIGGPTQTPSMRERGGRYGPSKLQIPC